MNLIIWNLRGANSARSHRPSMLVLLETKMKEHAGLTDDLGFGSQIQSPTIGLMGGLVIMWKDDALNL